MAVVTGNSNNETLSGTGSSDTISGNAGSDTIYGGASNDTLYGNNATGDNLNADGSDRIYGESGDDIIYGNLNNDTLSGGDGNDTVYGGRNNDSISGDAGNDTLYGNEDSDNISGGSGDDLIYGGATVTDPADSSDTLAGNSGNDTIYGNGGNDTINGNEGVDNIFGGSGDDVIYGGNGVNDAGDSADTIAGNEGNDTIYGNGGNDTLSGNENSDTIYGGQGDDLIYGGNGVSDTNDSSDNLYGNEGNDTIYANSGDNTVEGGQGSDTIYGGNGNDNITGQSGDDNLYGNEGNDTYWFDSGFDSGIGNDVILDDSGVDTISLSNISSLSNLSLSRDGSDLLIVVNSGGSIKVRNHFSGSAVENLRFSNGTIYNLVDLPLGGSGNDVINGNSSDNIIYGNSGADNIRGFEGNDLLFGDDAINGTHTNDGGDTIAGDDGNDVIYGNYGNDTLSGNANNDTIYGGNGNDLIFGGTGENDPSDAADILFGNEGGDTIYGNGGNDTISGNEGADTIYGGVGDDLIYGGGSIIDPADSADIINGNQGNDTIYGNGGNDNLFGNEGSDSIYGGTGDDLIYGGNAENDPADSADIIDGNEGSDRIYGNGGNDTLNGGDGDDLIYGGKGNNIIGGDGGSDKIYSAGENDVLTGGAGSDLFILNSSLEGFASTTITDFNGDKIDISALNISNFKDLKVAQVGNDAVIKSSNGEKIILTNTNKDSLAADDFINRSHQKILTIYNVGKPFDGIPNSVKSPQVIGKLNKFVIEGFDPKGVVTSGFDNAAQVIDLTRFHITNLSISDNNLGNAVVDLGNGQSLEIVGISRTQLSEKHFITAGETQQTVTGELLSAWDMVSEKVTTKIMSAEDSIAQYNGEVVYMAKANSLIFTNEDIAPPTINVKIFNVDGAHEGVQVVEGFDPNNPLHIIDMSAYKNVDAKDFLIYAKGNDTVIRIGGTANEILLKDVSPLQLSPTKLLGIDTKVGVNQSLDYVNMAIHTYSYSAVEDAENPTAKDVGDLYELDYDLGETGWQEVTTNTGLKFTSANLQVATSTDYFGEVFINKDSHQIVVATRGSYNLSDWTQDDGSLAVKVVAEQVGYATQFLTKVQDYVNHHPEFKDYSISTTGHSLGALVAQLSAIKMGVSSVTFDNPGVKEMAEALGLQYDPNSHIIINGAPNLVNSLAPQIGTILGLKHGGSLIDSAIKGIPVIGPLVNKFTAELTELANENPNLAPLINAINPTNYFGLFADSHSSLDFKAGLQKIKDAIKENKIDGAVAQTLYQDFTNIQPNNIAEMLLYRMVTGGKLPNELTGAQEVLWNAVSPFIGSENNLGGVNEIPVLSTIFKLDDFVVAAIQGQTQSVEQLLVDLFKINSFQDLKSPNGLFSSAILNNIIADLIRGENLSEAILLTRDRLVEAGVSNIGKSIFNSVTGGLQDKLKSELTPFMPSGNGAQDVIKSIFEDSTVAQKIMTDLPGNIATSLAMQAVQGKLCLDDSQIGYQIGMMVADAVVQAALAVMGLPPQMNVIVMAVIAEPLMKVFDFVGSIGMNIWDVIGDPINSIEDVISPDKFSRFTGTDNADLKYHDGDHQETHLKNGDDIFFGWEGWNIVFGEGGNDKIFGGGGTYNTSGNWLRPDELYSGAGDDYVSGLGGDDDIFGGAGSDYLIGGSGKDFITGGDYEGRYAFLQGGKGHHASATGSDGDDIIEGGADADVIIGGGKDISSYKNSSAAVQVDLNSKNASGVVAGYGGEAQGDRLYEIEGLIGSAYNDNLGGDNSANHIAGGAGNDVITAKGGSDNIFGNEGDDLIYGGSAISDPADSADVIHGNSGNDTIYGNGGNDTLFGNENSDVIYGGVGNDSIYGGNGENDPNDGADTLYGNDGNDTIYGNGGNDTIFGNEASDSIYGGAGDDLIYGGNGTADPTDSADVIYGNEGNDTIYGNGGDDNLFGNVGNDTIYGGDGADKIEGSAGDDSLIGGSGDDIYYLSSKSGNDVIFDALGNDTITFSDISNIGALTLSRKGNDLVIDTDLSGVLIKDHFANQTLEHLQFSDGSVFDLSDLVLAEESEEEKSISKYVSSALSIASNVAVATNDSFTDNEDNIITINFSDILSNDYDPKSAKLIFSNPSKGKLIVNSESITYRPNQDYNGYDSISYQIQDSDGKLSAAATINLDIRPTYDQIKINASIATKEAQIGQEFTYNLDNSWIKNTDNNNLEVALKSSDGSDLPSWLSFDKNTLELKGTPASGSYGLKTLLVIVSDGITTTQTTLHLVIGQTLQAKDDAHIIQAIQPTNNIDANVSAIEGSKDLVLGSDADDIAQYVADETWGADFVAYNPYTDDLFSLIAKHRSFDAFDGQGGNDSVKLTNLSDALFLDDLYSDNSSAGGSRLFGIETINGENGDDIIDLSSTDFTYGDITLNGGNGDDVLWGNDGNDTINGDSGNDHIVGGRGSDDMAGGDANDILKGYDGDDILNGGGGFDILTGGEGNDIFTFVNLTDSNINYSDLITDFTKGEDSINLSGLNFSSITADSSAPESTLIYHYDNDNNVTIIESYNQDLVIKLTGNIALEESDFNFG